MSQALIDRWRWRAYLTRRSIRLSPQRYSASEIAEAIGCARALERCADSLDRSLRRAAAKARVAKKGRRS